MFGVFQWALLVMFVGCSTLALPRVRRQGLADHKIEVVKQVPQCEQKTKMDDDVMVTIATSGEIAGHVIQGYLYVHKQFKLDDNPSILLEDGEALLGMCVGEIRRLKYRMDDELGDQSPMLVYEVTLENIGPGSGSVILSPPGIDTNGDRQQAEDELYEYLIAATEDLPPTDYPSSMYQVIADDMTVVLGGYLY